MQYSPRNIKIACEHGGLTHFGGAFFFHEFIRVLQLRRFLARHLHSVFGDHSLGVQPGDRFSTDLCA